MRLLHFVSSLMALFALAAGTHAQDDRPDGTRLFITYRCDAVSRVAFLKSLASESLPRLDAWKKDGVLADYVLLYNQFVDVDTWDAMVMVTFATYAQTDRWRAMERDFPGGLSAEQLKLGVPRNSYLADAAVAKGEPGDRTKSIFVVIPYEYRERAEYLDFVRTYGVPQFDAWIREKVIANYTVFLNHHAPGKPWDVLLVFEYNGIEGLAKRDIVKQKVREQLALDPAWKLAAEVKKELRTEYEVVMAGVVQPRAK